MTTRNFPLVQLAALLLALVVLAVMLRAVSLIAIWQLLKKLSWQQLFWLVMLNGAVWLCNAARWWLLLQARGAQIGYWRIFGYRFAVFAGSYVTPGPQLGGELLQIYLPTRREGVPVALALAALTGDKLIELLANFLFLAGGTLFILNQGLLRGVIGGQTLFLNLTLPLLPLAGIMLLWYGYRPLSQLLEQLPFMRTFEQHAEKTPVTFGSKLPPRQKIIEWIHAGEDQAVQLVQRQPGMMLIGLFISVVSWVFMIAEMWYASSIVGMALSLPATIAVLVALRLVYLIPVPAGIGAVEAGLLFVLTALGQSAESAVALSLLMRSRDIMRVLLGLWIGGRDLLRTAPQKVPAS